MSDYVDDTYLADSVVAVKDLLAAAFTTAARPFDRVVVYPGVPAWDCEMIAVWTQLILPVGPGTTNNPREMEGGLLTGWKVSADFLRCVTVFGAAEDGDAPSAAETTADGVGINTDYWIAWRALSEALLAGTIFDTCRARHISQSQTFTPAGGLAGFRLTMEIRL